MSEYISEGEYAITQDTDVGNPEEDYPRLAAPDGIWETSDGIQIAIGDMTDAHIRNAMRWMRGRGFECHYKYAELASERDRREGR